VESTAILDENFVPNSWVYADVGFVPMEYSHVELLNDPTCNPETYTDFFIELGSKLRDLGLSTLVGPALTSSPLVEKNRPQGATQMLEMTALDDRANILRYVLDNPGLKEQHIETFWSWGGGSEAPDSPKEPGDANPSRAPRVNPMRTCTRICPSVQNPPVHQGTFIHRSQ